MVCEVVDGGVDYVELTEEVVRDRRDIGQWGFRLEEIGGGGEQKNKEMNIFVCSSSAPPISEAIARNTITRGASIDSSIDLRASLHSNDNLASEG